MVLVSIVVPAFNAEATLREAVDSALTGTFREIEVIIVDDGSTDATAEVAKDLVRSDPRVKLIQRHNGGVSAAFNSGLAAAKGDYVARLDSDDLWHPAKLERQVAVARSSPGSPFIYTFVRYIDASGRVVHDGPDQRFPPYALCRGVYESLAGANSSAMMLRCAAVKCGGYDEELVSWEDLLLQLKINATGPIAFVPEYLVGYRIRPASLSADVPTMVESWRLVRRKIRSEFPQLPALVDRWAHARRCAEFAEAFAWRGNYPMCFRLLAEAAWHDWAWTSRLLFYRSMRRIRRGSSPRQTRPAGPDFRRCDPADRLPASPPDQESHPFALQAERIDRITDLDEQLAAAAVESSSAPLAEAAQGNSPPAPAGP